MSEDSKQAGFAPDDLTDGREKGEWTTRYPDAAARRAIRLEATYISTLFFICPTLLFLTWSLTHKQLSYISPICSYLYAWIGGLFGGASFSLKWLYHSVAHAIWNIDRRLWRLFSPHLSAGLAFVFICLIKSNMLTVFNASAIRSSATVLSIAFLVGYFSDTALAKLSDVAYSLFGTTEHSRQRSRESGK